MADKITIDTYNKYAGEMAEKFNKIGPRTIDVNRAFEIIKKKNPKVVELGCGNGRDAQEILKHTNDYIGIDASTSMIDLAKEFLPNTNFEVNTIENFEFKDGIDIIFAFASLLHLDKKEVEKVLSRTREKLSTNGIWYISVKRDSYQGKVVTDRFGDRLFYFYELKDFEELANKTNFKIIFSDEQNLLGVDWLTVVLQKK